MTDDDKRRERLEIDIRLALEAVRGARHAQEHSPNPATEQRVTDAQADLDRLLDKHRAEYGTELVKG